MCAAGCLKSLIEDYWASGLGSIPACTVGSGVGISHRFGIAWPFPTVQAAGSSERYRKHNSAHQEHAVAGNDRHYLLEGNSSAELLSWLAYSTFFGQGKTTAFIASRAAFNV